MNFEEVKETFIVLALRKRLIVKLAVLTGLRPGVGCRSITPRFGKGSIGGEVDTPKANSSIREVALSKGLLTEIEEWRKVSLDTKPTAWIFPSETMKTAVAKDNCWRRHIGPKLKEIGLGWVNFQVMRRTHSTLMNRLKVDPKVVADQLGHSLDVNQNVYTQAPLERRLEAVNALEGALGVR
jgi:integrase